MSGIKQFYDLLSSRQGRLLIQTHNFPDHDAVASAFGLQQLLKKKNIQTEILYEGEIQRESLRTAIDSLGIALHRAGDLGPVDSDSIIVIDGCKGAKNVTDLPGDEIAVIDHHQVECPETVSYADIRSGYGACSSLIYEYWQDAGLVPDKTTATALMIGLNMDTALLTRDVSVHDVEAYSSLYPLADMRLVSSILRNYIQVKDLNFYKHAIDSLVIQGAFAFCYFPEGCNQNLLGILGDFFLSLEEAEFIVLCAKNEKKINISVRSENPRWNAAFIVEDVLRGIGFGGGHTDMAGGMITNLKLFDVNKIFRMFLTHLN